jgi:hypothetical protein
MCREQKEAMVAEVVRCGSLLLTICRLFGRKEVAEWHDFGLVLSDTSLREVNVVLYWLLSKNQEYIGYENVKMFCLVCVFGVESKLQQH